MPEAGLRVWFRVGLAALAVTVLAIPLSLLREPQGEAASSLEAEPTFAGTQACRECHRVEYERWFGSDHDLAMDVATDTTVLGDFSGVEATFHGTTSRFFRRDGRYVIETEGPDGELAEFVVSHTFGHDPLQQYLTPFPGGRLQAFHLAWDRIRGEWFHLYPGQDIPPGDWLHWTRNGQNWKGMCAECHSTNLIKGFDAEAQTYDTTWSDIDVGCEACHGPGSRHVAWAEIPPMGRPAVADAGLLVSTAGIAPQRLVELCAPCHARRAELGDYDHTATEMLDRHLPSLLREGLYHADGQILDEVYVYGSFLQSKMYARDVTCRDCHDSHSLQLHRDGNELCLQCHQREVYDTRDHHFHKKVHEGRPSDGALCVKCHMVEQPYMVIDWRADHSFRVPRPDLSLEIGTPNACTQSGCHADKPLQWSVDAFTRWYGQAKKPHFGTTLTAAREGHAEAVPELVRLAESELQPAIVRATALEELARFPGQGDEALRMALQSDVALLRHTATMRMVASSPEELVELLAPLLSDPVRGVRMAAVGQLAAVQRELFKPYQLEAFDHALVEFRRSVAYSLDFASSGLNLGNLESALGNRPAAEAAYRQALDVDDLFYPAAMNLAILLAGEGRIDESEELLRGVLGAYPDNPDAAYSLGLLLVEAGRADEAVELLVRAVEGRPNQARWHYNLGLLLQQQGRLVEAGEQLRVAAELAPDQLDVLHALADHELRRGRLREALAVAERMIEISPDAPVGHQIRALIERELDRGSGAVPGP